MPEPTAEEIAAKAEADRLEAEAKAKANAEAGDKKFTQADLDRIAGDTRKAASEKAAKDLLDALGVTDLDAAKAALAAAKEAENAKLTETERLTKERDEALRREAETLANATQLFAASKLEGALRDAGVSPERLPAALRLADTSAIKVEGTEVTGVTEVVDSIKALTPEWFGVKKPGAVDATGGGAGGEVDYKAVSRDELAAAARKYGVKL